MSPEVLLRGFFLFCLFLGIFPFLLELKWTKPYGNSLFNFDAMTSVCQILSTKEDIFFSYTTTNGLNIAFIEPYNANKSIWSYPKDVMYWEEWTVR